MKVGSSLVVAPSSIPSSTTCGPDVDLSFEGSKDILEDPDNEPVLKKRIFYSDDKKDAPPKTEFIGMYLSPFFLFLAKSIPPPFFVISSLGACICVSPLLQFPLISPYFVEIFERLGVIIEVDMPSATTPTTPIALVSTIPIVPVSAVPFVPVFAIPITSILMGLSEFLDSSLIFFLRVYCS